MNSLLETIEFFFLQSKYKIMLSIMKLITHVVDTKQLHSLIRIYDLKNWEQNELLAFGKITLSNDPLRYPKRPNQTSWKSKTTKSASWVVFH